jgi:hypothetical protein
MPCPGVLPTAVHPNHTSEICARLHLVHKRPHLVHLVHASAAGVGRWGSCQIAPAGDGHRQARPESARPLCGRRVLLCLTQGPAMQSKLVASCFRPARWPAITLPCRRFSPRKCAGMCARAVYTADLRVASWNPRLVVSLASASLHNIVSSLTTASQLHKAAWRLTARHHLTGDPALARWWQSGWWRSLPDHQCGLSNLTAPCQISRLATEQRVGCRAQVHPERHTQHHQSTTPDQPLAERTLGAQRSPPCPRHGCQVGDAHRQASLVSILAWSW